MIFLLDVNALLAYHYPTHVHHARVKAWVAQLRAGPEGDNLVFATCPIIELGFVRVGSGPAALADSVDTARANLRALKAREKMLFISRRHPRARSARLGAEAGSHNGWLPARASEDARWTASDAG